MEEDIETLKRILEKERASRKKAEEIMERKSKELSITNEKLKQLNLSLEKEIEDRVNEIAQTKDRYKHLVESVSEIIYRANNKGQFTYINASGGKILGYTEEEILKMHFTEIINPYHQGRVLAFYIDQYRGKSNKTYMEFPVITKDGQEIWIGQHVSFLIDENGHQEFLAVARDITKVKMAELGLIMSEEKYRNIIENLELGLMEVDTEGIIIQAYPKFCELTGYTSEELEGSPGFEKLLTEDNRAFMMRQIEKRKKGDSGVYEIQLRKKDGSMVWVMISAAPLYDHTKRQIGSLGIHLDISDRKRMEEELIKAKDIAERSVKSKELFMANMSHEIRTPMNAIIGITELLGKTELSNQQKDYIDIVASSAESLIMIINDILDFSKIESGMLELESIPTNIPEIVEKTCNTLRLKAVRKGITVLTKIDPEITEQVISDPIRLNQILLNLLSNALKFTSIGTISIRVKLKENTSESYLLHFEVTDTGIGIAKENIEKIFESFAQAEESTTRKYGGTGLGLSITRNLVQMLGGQLEVKSKVGEGSCFFFSVSMKKTSTNNTTREVSVIGNELGGLKILVVEDNEINLFMATTILESWHCEVDTATNGMEAIQRVKENQFDIILMDIRMPEMDGIQATKHIRRDLKIKTPVIALTANAIKGDHQICLDAGMNGYVTKPFKQESLYGAIIEHKPSFTPHNTKLTGSIDDTASVPQRIFDHGNDSFKDLSMLEEITKGNAEFMSRMILMFIEDTPSKIALMLSGIDNQDYKQVSSIAHKIKPSIDAVACQAMRDDVRKLESWKGNVEELVAAAQLFISRTEALIKELQNTEI